MKHTSGPWKLGEWDKILTASGDVLHVAGVALPMGGYGDREEEFKANARLIAAAPEMYEALTNAKALVIGWCVHYAMQDAQTKEDYERATHPENWNPIHQEIYRKVDEAIRKAEEGGQ